MPKVIMITAPPMIVSKVGCSLTTNQTQIGPIIVSSKIKNDKRKNKGNIDWNQQIENAMLKLSAILTLWVLVDRVQTQ